MTNRNRWFNDAALADEISDESLRKVLLEGLHGIYSLGNAGKAEALVDYLMREIARRVKHGAPKGKAALAILADLGRIQIRTPSGSSGHLIPIDLLVEAERLGFDLRDIMTQIKVLHKAIRDHFAEPEQLQALQLGIGALRTVFHRETDQMRFAQVLRTDARTIQLAIALALRHQFGHDHPDRPSSAPADTAPAALTDTLARFAAALPDALPAAALLRQHGLKHGEITALSDYFSCAGCLLEIGLSILLGKDSPEVVRELARNVGWLGAQEIQFMEVRKILDWRREHSPPFDFRETVELMKTVADVVAVPSGLETLLRCSTDPATIRAASDALRAHGLTLAWLVAGYRDCGQKIPFAQYVKAVRKFGERAKALVRAGGNCPRAFLEACLQIGINRARAIAQRVKPASATQYKELDKLQQMHPQIPLCTLETYRTRGFSADEIARCARACERFGVPHSWLATVNLGARTSEALALAYLYGQALKRKPAAWEINLLAHREFLREARRRGLKRALRGNGEWLENAIAHRGSARVQNNNHPQETVEAVPITAAHAIRRPRPQDPRQLRFWVAWRIVKRMWAGRQFGASNVSPEDQRARNLPSDLIGMFDEAYAALVKDGVILARDGGIYTRASLNPEKLKVIHAILEYHVPSGTALEQWVNRGRENE